MIKINGAGLLIFSLYCLRDLAFASECASDRRAQVCAPEAVDEDISAHTSLLQTSLSLSPLVDVPAPALSQHRDQGTKTGSSSRFSWRRLRKYRRASSAKNMDVKAAALVERGKEGKGSGGAGGSGGSAGGKGGNEDSISQAQKMSPQEKRKRSRHMFARFMVVVVSLTLLVAAIVAFRSRRRHQDASGSTEDLASRDDVERRKPGEMNEDVYSLAIALVVRDIQAISKGTTTWRLRATRITYGVSILFLAIAIQVTLLWATKVYVTPQAVAGIRDAYDQYEVHMYGEMHTRLLYTGKHRGLPGYFNPKKFDSLDDDLKGTVCEIPFSQLYFLVLVLLIWSITCINQIRLCVRYFLELVVWLPSASSMADSMKMMRLDMSSTLTTTPTAPNSQLDSGGEESMSLWDMKPMPTLAADDDCKTQGQQRRTIVGLTTTVKVVLTFTVFLPWFLSTCYLTWLGCRWLSATAAFADLVNNCMALEFILYFKDLLYFAVASDRTKREVRRTQIRPPTKREPPSWVGYFNAIGWGLLAFAWVFIYVFKLQRVLPEYQWDVHEVCTPYLLSISVPGSAASIAAQGWDT